MGQSSTPEAHTITPGREWRSSQREQSDGRCVEGAARQGSSAAFVMCLGVLTSTGSRNAVLWESLAVNGRSVSTIRLAVGCAAWFCGRMSYDGLYVAFCEGQGPLRVAASSFGIVPSLILGSPLHGPMKRQLPAYLIDL